jgi:hypothetical protein
MLRTAGPVMALRHVTCIVLRMPPKKSRTGTNWSRSTV